MVDGYPGIELVEEYLDQNQPDYVWEVNENLVVCLRFPDEKRLNYQFQKFVVENQDRARNIQTIESKKEIEEWEKATKREEEERKKAREKELELQKQQGFDKFQFIAVEDAPDPKKDDESEEPDSKNQPPAPIFKRIIWGKGLVLDYQIQVGDREDRTLDIPTEIRCDVEPNVILVKVGNEEKTQHKRKALSAIINAFSVSAEIERFAICNCPLCQEVERQKPGTAHRIPYQKLENLKERYVPKIQCYGSGKAQRLDEISILERPKIKVRVIHATLFDNEFCDKVEEWFLKRDLDVDFWSKKVTEVGDDFLQEIKVKISESDIIVVLISPSLINDDLALDEMLEPSIKKANKQDVLLLGLVVRETVSWQECSPFNQLVSPIPILSEKPITSLEAHEIDRVWKTSGEKLHAEIEKWLNETHRFKLKK